MTTAGELERAVRHHRDRLASVLPAEIMAGGAVVFDFTDDGEGTSEIDPGDARGFTSYVRGELESHGVVLGIGRWAEDRTIYRHSALFAGEDEPRTVHLGIDLFAAAGTPVSAPLGGTVHSWADNDRLGDYGPTILLAHVLDGIGFSTLYGHLSRESLVGLESGRQIATGEVFAAVGSVEENGAWPPHLHFQLITELGGRRGDFPGVARQSEREAFLERCPDPSVILGLDRISRVVQL